MRRDWTAAVAHWKGEGCVVCGSPYVDLAHTIGRKYDRKASERGNVIEVDPLAVVPLCSRAKGGSGHHEMYDSYRLNLMPYLFRFPDVVAWARERIGAGQADRHLLGPDWRE